MLLCVFKLNVRSQHCNLTKNLYFIYSSLNDFSYHYGSYNYHGYYKKKPSHVDEVSLLFT